ncbi:MAG: hypothetical protein WBA45_08585 [Microthrixaceae bacterium]
MAWKNGTGRTSTAVSAIPGGQLAQLTVLHVDKDFELIADITGQRVERLTVS